MSINPTCNIKDDHSNVRIANIRGDEASEPSSSKIIYYDLIRTLVPPYPIVVSELDVFLNRLFSIGNQFQL